MATFMLQVVILGAFLAFAVVTWGLKLSSAAIALGALILARSLKRLRKSLRRLTEDRQASDRLLDDG